VNCTNCNSKTKTVDTRQYLEADLGFNWACRRIKCEGCGLISKTVELPQEEYEKMYNAYVKNWD
jgi:hypothetical protein